MKTAKATAGNRWISFVTMNELTEAIRDGKPGRYLAENKSGKMRWVTCRIGTSTRRRVQFFAQFCDALLYLYEHDGGKQNGNDLQNQQKRRPRSILQSRPEGSESHEPET